MTSTIESLKADVADELGLEVWNVYDGGRHLVAEVLIAAVATACVTEFFKGLLDPNGLGDGTRAWMLNVSALFRARRQLESLTDAGELEELYRQARKAVREASDKDATLERAQGELKGALVAFGLTEQSATERAERVAVRVWADIVRS
jgi:hypothetical protein